VPTACFTTQLLFRMLGISLKRLLRFLSAAGPSPSRNLRTVMSMREGRCQAAAVRSVKGTSHCAMLLSDIHTLHPAEIRKQRHLARLALKGNFALPSLQPCS